jgi:hypothetical protein
MLVCVCACSVCYARYTNIIPNSFCSSNLADSLGQRFIEQGPICHGLLVLVYLCVCVCVCARVSHLSQHSPRLSGSPPSRFLLSPPFSCSLAPSISQSCAHSLSCARSPSLNSPWGHGRGQRGANLHACLGQIDRQRGRTGERERERERETDRQRERCQHKCALPKGPGREACLSTSAGPAIQTAP